MNFVKCKNSPSPFSGICIHCGKPFNTANETVYADTLGEPFKAYYHSRCVPHARFVRERDCERWERDNLDTINQGPDFT